jgi:hypothetical protein
MSDGRNRKKALYLCPTKPEVLYPLSPPSSTASPPRYLPARAPASPRRPPCLPALLPCLLPVLSPRIPPRSLFPVDSPRLNVNGDSCSAIWDGSACSGGGLRWRGESSTLDLLWSCDAQSGGHGEEGGDELVRCDVLDEASTFFPPWRAEALQWVVVRPLDGLPALFLAVPHLLPASRGTTTTARRLLRRDALFLFQRYSFSSLSQNKIPT